MSSIMFSILVIISTAVETWPSFLGPVPSHLQSSNLPLEWTPTDGLQRMVEVPGHGQLSPVVWANKLFFTSVKGAMKDVYHVTCLDVRDGNKVWSYRLKNSVPVTNSYYVSRAAPTPTVAPVEVEDILTENESR